VKRNWEKRIELGGEAKELGERWLAEQKKVFELWHRFKDKKCTREAMLAEMTAAVKSLGEAP
jgi:hypothetical protein